MRFIRFIAVYVFLNLMGIGFLSAKDLCRHLLSSLHGITPEALMESLQIKAGEHFHLSFEDWDDNLVVMYPSRIYLRNFATGEERGVTTDEYARMKHLAGKPGTEWEAWQFFDFLVHPDGSEELINLERRNAISPHLGKPGEYEKHRLREGSWIDFRDVPNPHVFQDHIRKITSEPRGWIGPRWYLLNGRLSQEGTRRRTGVITTRGHAPQSFVEATEELASRGLLPASLTRELIFPIYNPAFPQDIGAWPHERKASVLKAFVELAQKLPPAANGKKHQIEFADDDLKTLEHLRKVFQEMSQNRELGNVEVVLHLTLLNQLSTWTFKDIDESLAVGGNLITIPHRIPPNLVFTRSQVEILMRERKISKAQLMLEIIRDAQNRPDPQVTDYRAVVVGEGETGNLYLGFNLEFSRNSPNHTIHAEQTMLALMALHGESGLRSIALSAAPCGHCRQFMFEVKNAAEIEVYVPGKSPTTLGQLLPESFGPKDLKHDGDLLHRDLLQFESDNLPKDDFGSKALPFVLSSYAPYSKGFSGVGVRTASGAEYFGFYLENAAINPGLSPLAMALIEMQRAGVPYDQIREVVLIENAAGSISHEWNVRGLLKTISPGAKLRVYRPKISELRKLGD